MSSEYEVKPTRQSIVRWVLKCDSLKEAGKPALRAYLEETREQIAEAVKEVTRKTSCSSEEKLHRHNAYPLHLSAIKDVECCARTLLQHGWPVDERYSGDLHTALHLACQFNSWRTARLLLDNGADSDAVISDCSSGKPRYPLTPLIITILYYAHTCMHMLANEHVDVVVRIDETAEGSANAMVCAAIVDNVCALRRLMSSYSIDELFVGKNEPLMAAASLCRYESLKMLLNYAMEQRNSTDIADLVNIPTENLTPLSAIGRMCRVPRNNDEAKREEAKHLDCLKLLLECGADANKPRSIGGYPALYYALRRRGCGSEYCDILLKHTDLEAMEAETRDSLVYEAAFRGRTDVMRILYEKDEELVRRNGFDLILRAALSPFLDAEMIDLLLEQGVDVVRKEHLKNCNYAESIYRSRDPPSPYVMLNVLEMLLKAGAAENVNVYVQCMLRIFNQESFVRESLELLWKYGTQTHWNAIVRNSIGCHEFVPRLPSLQHSCRSALRSTLLSTGRFQSMRKVDVRKLGLPGSLESYITFSSVDQADSRARPIVQPW